MQNTVQPKFRIIPRSIFRSDIFKNYKFMKLKIIEELSNFNYVISITFNLWIATN